MEDYPFKGRVGLPGRYDHQLAVRLLVGPHGAAGLQRLGVFRRVGGDKVIQAGGGLGLGLAMVGVDGAGGGTPTISIHTASE